MYSVYCLMRLVIVRFLFGALRGVYGLLFCVYACLFVIFCVVVLAVLMAMALMTVKG